MPRWAMLIPIDWVSAYLIWRLKNVYDNKFSQNCQRANVFKKTNLSILAIENIAKLSTKLE